MRLLNVRACPREDCTAAANFLQSPFWAEFKERFGWRAFSFFFEYEADSTVREAPLMVLCRRLAGTVSFAYIPWGPPLDYNTDKDSLLTALARALRPLLPPDIAFLRLDPPWYAEGQDVPGLAPPWVKASTSIQAPDTVLLDLRDEPEVILARMKSKWRYNVRLGGKKVTVRQAAQSAAWTDDGEQALACFYTLLRETAARDKIAIHSFDYYRNLFELAGEKGPDIDVRLYLADLAGVPAGTPATLPVAGIITLFRGAEAVYLYGASANEHREVMAPYALQWQAIQDAKNAGALRYDFFGIPPNDNPRHPMAGLYRFKTGFGGTIIHRPGTWDFPYKPFAYRVFSMAEKLRKMLRGLRKRR
jgi:lipid II:glycine glycyltransferase (peptidoglycan interpeptide bridge formation enzyme)